MRNFFRRITRRGVLTLLTGLLVALPLGSAAAADAPVLARISESGTLKVGMSAGQPPFNFQSREGKIIGMDVDLAGLLAVALNVDLEIVDMPFGQLLPALESGKVDLVISGMTATLPRNMRAAFVGPYHVTGKSILARTETLAALGGTEASDALAEVDEEARYPVQHLRHGVGIHLLDLLGGDNRDILRHLGHGLRVPCGRYHEVLFLVEHAEDLHLLFNLGEGGMGQGKCGDDNAEARDNFP